jgi:3'-phosphoadenosine 5'-phosphosulfate sulfotransferase (PAPS reductase)/FAD synthetase
MSPLSGRKDNMAITTSSKKTESLLLTDQLKTDVADKSTQAQNLLNQSFDDYKNICFATSMGAEDMVIYDLINKMNRSIDIFTLDTGRLHAETYELISHINSNFKNKIKIFFLMQMRLKIMWIQEESTIFITHSIQEKNAAV